MDPQIAAIHRNNFTSQNEECTVEFNTGEKMKSELLNFNSGHLTCVHCDFTYTDHETLEKHLGSIHPEFSDLTNVVMHQKTAKLFHCQLCFYTNKVYRNVYNHVAMQHPEPSKSEIASQIKELIAGTGKETNKQSRVTKRKLKEAKVIEKGKSPKKKRGRKKKRSEIIANTVEIKPTKPVEPSVTTVDGQPVKRKPGRPKRKVEEVKTDLNCTKCGTRFSSLNELNIHNCQKKKLKDSNSPPYELEFSDYSGQFPIKYGSTRKSIALSNTSKELAGSNKFEKSTVLTNPDKLTISNNPAVHAMSNDFSELTNADNAMKLPTPLDPAETSAEKDYVKRLQENVKYVRGTFHCNTCKFHCKSKSSALYHVVRVHDKPYPYKCGECGRCFVMDKELQRHMSVHTGEAYYKCSKCDFESDYARAFKNHEKQCTAQPREDTCSENIDAKKQQNTVQEIKSLGPESPSVPPPSFVKEEAQSQENSLSKVEPSEAELPAETEKKCVEQSAGQVQASKLPHLEAAKPTAAYQQDSGSPKESISCPECGKMFEEQDMYQKHKVFHAVQKPLISEITREVSVSDEEKTAERKIFSCIPCNVKYQSEEDLQHHLNIHKPNAEGKNFNCDICSARFDKQIDLRDHLKIHRQNISKTNQTGMPDNRTLYRCNYCPYSTYLFVNYIGHVKIAHSNEFPIHCTSCGDGFQLPGELRKHKCQQSQSGGIISSQGDE
ncbi:zinc finger protein 208 [Leucoraja erinacea]|uniref:zinc finger protein 208 n=1 Tax=Leucoraja erinaceus TaxID=7782 RepID=UPI002457DD24|nr:zinc finger protein 208 [Leucoraja erinacea]XP_055493048.1 zinc finger protein 208 [Leucoraja erinacea]XP_055493049.1 zinc finger protein 208 [Leucoraja erinacea]XP_055493050.1 zinc finger protein 208 [Leucoraja erinacea]XP_055493051.1 zinc finger protein 208 [Leucoraja erinacea]XP_055493052.1 zinc finger protein 208 [Leucoraja erinacea]